MEGETNDIFRDDGVFDAPITPETFQRLRNCLTDRPHEAELGHEFQTRIQLPVEHLASFVHALHRLSLEAFPEVDRVDRTAKVLTQILVALDTARCLEQVEVVLGRDELPEIPALAPVSGRLPQRPFRPRSDHIRPWYPPRQARLTLRTSLKD
ncbi:unnamed protein product [Echinostoma caproni]|uniref:Segregation and condensation protein A n=1 Tax=Echinostoma caproni TaxID=27848 RepID=A0A183AQZ1_9TREM|nr:unnamed protein product [Echinostoma caproni]